MEKSIGIDLGTTYSCVGIWQNDQVTIIPNDKGNYTTPSWVAFTDTEQVVGEDAMTKFFNPANTISNAKRLIGRNYSEAFLSFDIKSLPFKIVETESKKAAIDVEFMGQRKHFLPSEISSIILAKMKKISEAYLKAPVKNAVITVPAYFNDSQRQATKDAGILAGLTVLRVINEPTAAAIAYGYDKLSDDSECSCLIFDLGGATFDVTVLLIDEGIYEVRATSGDYQLGGRDFDQRMVEFFIRQFKRKYKHDISHDAQAVHRLRNACERAKITLSFETEASIELEDFYKGINFRTSISRPLFEELNDDLFQKTLESVSKVLYDARLEARDIQRIAMIGGSSYIPKVRNLLKQFFGGRELDISIKPDQAVAYGASVQAAILNPNSSHKIPDLIILDVNPLSLGVKVAGGAFAPVIRRNTCIPVRKQAIFSTCHDNQKSVLIKVYEGERTMTRDCNLLGSFELSGISPALAGVPQIEITFDVDPNGILTVTAKDKTSGRESKLVIANDQNRLSLGQLTQMIEDSVKYHNEDIQALKATTKLPNSRSITLVSPTNSNCSNNHSVTVEEVD